MAEVSAADHRSVGAQHHNTARPGWGVLAAVLTVFAVVALTNMESGLHGDARATNPDPGPAPYPPFLGVDNWPLVTSLVSVASTVGFLGGLACWSMRERRVHWAVIIGGAAFLAGSLDPLANWATFTMFDPRVAHFPLSWPYFNISPLLEPTLSFLGGYASYYVLTGLGLLSAHQRFIEPRIRRETWLGRHRLVAVFLTGFVIGLPLNAVMQFMWLRVGLFVYTQAAGPVLQIADRCLPVLMIIYDSALFAIVAVLCVRDDNGRPALVAKLAQRLPSFAGRPAATAGRMMLIATALLMTVVLGPIGVFSALRVGGDPAPAYDKFPYPLVKVYDPYGDLERTGKPGPFYR